MAQRIFEFFVKVVTYGGGPVVIAYLVFIFLGKRTLENWFAKRLRKFEYKLNSLLNRVTKIHEKEFEVLPHAWTKLHDLLDSIRRFIRYTNSPDDLDKMSDEELEKFLTGFCLDQQAKDNIRARKYKNSWFSSEIGNVCLDFQNYIARNAIFLSPDIKSKFEKAEYSIRQVWAVIESRRDLQAATEVSKIIKEQVEPIMKDIEGLVQKRLRFHEA